MKLLEIKDCEKQMIDDVLNEWKKHEDMEFYLLQYYFKMPYMKWLEFIEKLKHFETNHSTYCTSYNYALIDNDKCVGFCAIRIDDNEYVNKYAGHIGYSIGYQYRHMGYGKIIFKLVLEKAKEIGLNRVLVTTEKQNIYSIKVIDSYIKDHSNYEKSENEEIYYYWIDLKG